MNRKVNAGDLRLLCFDPVNVTPLSKLLDWNFSSRQTVVTCTGSLQEYIGSCDRLPDVILINDPTVPDTALSSVFDAARPESGRGDLAINVVWEHNMPGVQALRLLRDPESPARDIPVVIFDTSHPAIFFKEGATSVVTAADLKEHCGPPIRDFIKAVLEKAIGAEIVHENPHRRHDLKINVIPNPVEEMKNPDDIYLRGAQRYYFQHALVWKAKQLLDADFVKEFTASVEYEHFSSQFPDLVPRRNGRDALIFFQNVSKILMWYAPKAECDSTLADVLRGIIHECRQAGDIGSQAVCLMASHMAGNCLDNACERAVAEGDLEGELNPDQVRLLRNLLEGQLARMENIGAVDLEETRMARQALYGIDDPDDEEEFRPDEGAVVEFSLAVLRVLADSLNACEPLPAQALSDLLEEMAVCSATPEGDYAFTMIYGFVREAVETVMRPDCPGPGRIYDADEIADARRIMAEAVWSSETGPKTKALLQALSAKMPLVPDEHGMDVMIRTLAQSEKYSDPKGWAGLNAMRIGRRAFAAGLGPQARGPGMPPPAPGI